MGLQQSESELQVRGIEMATDQKWQGTEIASGTKRRDRSGGTENSCTLYNILLKFEQYESL